MTQRRLILILGDQLSRDMSSLADARRETDTILMAEVSGEASYVPHHKKKIAFLFSAMRHFAQELREDGWTVRYTAYDDPSNSHTLPGEVERAARDLKPERILVTEPGEHRLLGALQALREEQDLPLDILEDCRFLASHSDFDSWAEGRKSLRMEYFYREIRRKTGLLMDGASPAGGRWNFDAENRKPASGGLLLPRPLQVEPDQITQDVLALVERNFAGNFGTLRPFWFAVTRRDALRALDHFIAEALPGFGDYQDAMLQGEAFLWHSVLSQYLNAGLLGPMEICRRAEAAYYEGNAPLNAVEGFIRQIIGWREYVRGIYWREGPGYTRRNALDAGRPLPEFYWSAETDMVCMAAAIAQTREEAYAHHIQRLMVTGNFAMLAGISPHEVHEWYLAVYADAYEWVEAPNVIGMSQFADGGLLASKPYAASGNYISKMSDYCKSCRYEVRKKHGAGACPFNPLYWDFLARNRGKLGGNPRLAQPYRTWDQMAPDTQDAYRASAQAVLASL